MVSAILRNFVLSFVLVYGNCIKGSIELRQIHLLEDALTYWKVNEVDRNWFKALYVKS